MIHFSYTNDNNVSLDERGNAESIFIEKLGPFKDEFEQKNGVVRIDFLDKENIGYHFDLENRHDFIRRWNEYIHQLPENLKERH